jgi:predicted MFS family arabinose efflux permease
VSVATVTAAPVGAYIGDLWGWRTAFVIGAIVGLVALAVQLATVPKLPPVAAPSLGTLIELIRRPSMRIALIALVLVVSGHFAGFTYIRPFLEQVPALGIETISLVLLGYGVGGFFGNFAGALVIERSLRAAVAIGSLLIAAMAILLVAFGSSSALSGIAVAIWGFAFGWLPVGFQTWTVRAAPDQAEGGGGLLVTGFQVAITFGAVLGGLLVDGFGPLGAVGYSGLAALVGGAVVLALGGKGLPKAS